MNTTPHAVGRPPDSRGTGRRWARRAVAFAAVGALPLAGVTGALAATDITTPSSGAITAVGPTNSEYGFPAWYEDKSGTRVELCLNGQDPMCGFVGAPVAGFNETQPAVFPTNFPDEQFYFLAGSTLTLPNGGKAVLTLGLEAAFTNTVQNGDQITFARQRVFVTGGPANTELTFQEPYGTIRVDTDGSGRAHFTQDIAPSQGNFTTPLKSGVGPFLTASNGPIVTDSGTYLGDPAQLTTVKNGPNGNIFSVNYTDAAGPKSASIDQFNVQGKISTNTGFDSTAAMLSADGKTVDVFAQSKADTGELFVSADSAAGIPSTPMLDSSGSGAKSFYARVPVSASAPAKVTLTNIGDKPASTIQVDVTKPSPISVTDATYDGTKLHVAATSTAAGALTVQGYGATVTNGVADITTSAPPAVVTVTDPATNKGTATVRVTGGSTSTPGQPPVAPSAATDPVCTAADPNGGPDVVVPCTNGAPATTATPVAKVAVATTPAVALGGTVPLDASTSTNAASYEWSSVSGPPVTFTNGTTAKPTATPQPYDVSKYTSANLPKAAQTTAAVVQVVAVNGTTKSAPVQVSIPVNVDTVQVTTNRYKAGSEYRLDGTSTLASGQLVLTPPTTVTVYNANTGKLVGTTQVDTTGAWSLRLRAPFAAGQDLAANVRIVTSRGGVLSSTVPGAPN
jgi:hypothetical protein